MDRKDFMEGTTLSAEALTGIIEQERIITHFQPILSLKNRSLIGFEALSRAVDERGNTIAPAILFDAARRSGRAVEVDRLCRSRAIRRFRCMAASGQYDPAPLLFLNFDTSLLDLGVAGSGVLRKQVSELNVPPSRVIIEIVENQVKDIAALDRFVLDYRKHGFIIALDDVGAGYSNFDRITIIKPDIIKIDRSIISDIHRDYYKQEIFKALVRLSRKIGTLVLAEGVETIGECLCVLDKDTDLLQGFFLARPSDPAAISVEALNDIASRTADRFREINIAKINRISAQHRIHREISGGMISTLSVNPPDRFETALRAAIEGLPLVEAVYVLDEKGIMVTDTILRQRRRTKTNMLFRKAGRGDNLSLKDYFYLVMFTGLQNYVTESYISWATGNLTRTLSAPFEGLSGKRYVLCVDVQADTTIDVTSDGI